MGVKTMLRTQLEYQAMLDNLTATQRRCSELLEEKREYIRLIAGLRERIRFLEDQLYGSKHDEVPSGAV